MYSTCLKVYTNILLHECLRKLYTEAWHDNIGRDKIYYFPARD